MPIPSPRKNEEKNNFISRCMGNSTMVSEYPEQKQRAGICYSQWRNKMKSNLHFLIVHNEISIRNETLNNEQYTVFPVIMMTVGVHSGSLGPILYTKEALSTFCQTWNGVPVTLKHPEYEGQPVSANHPIFYQSQVVGTVFNTHFEEDKLKAEIWINTNKINQLHPDLLAKINSGLKLDVSTGLFDESINEEGEWNGEKYVAIANNIRPDHLALLPGEVGACSWADGCGVRANKEKKMIRTKGVITNKEKEENIFIYSETFTINQLSYDDIMNAVGSKLDSMDIRDEKYHHMRQLYPDHVIYKVYNRGTLNESKMYKRAYSINENKEVEWTSDPKEVRESISYIDVTHNTLNKEEESMKIMKECCPLKVDEFIKANSKFTEKDKDWLLNMDEDAFARIIEVSAKEVVTNTVTPKEVTFNELLEKADISIKDSIQHGISLFNDTKKSMIEKIKANKTNKFTEEELSGFQFDFLKKLSESITGETVFPPQNVMKANFGSTLEAEPLPETEDWTKNK